MKQILRQKTPRFLHAKSVTLYALREVTGTDTSPHESTRMKQMKQILRQKTPHHLRVRNVENA